METRERIVRCLDRTAPGTRRAGGLPVRGDHDLNPGMGPPSAGTPAAVLVPLIEQAAGFTVLFTRRADGLPDHPGEISFPGGRLEASDGGPEEAALREAEEELGLSRGRVTVLGRLDHYETRTGFSVAPVVGLVRPPLALRPDPVEVAEVFEVPLAHILDPANHQRHRARAGGRLRCFHAIEYQDRFIWGATAGMLINLCEVLGRP